MRETAGQTQTRGMAVRCGHGRQAADVYKGDGGWNIDKGMGWADMDEGEIGACKTMGMLWMWTRETVVDVTRGMVPGVEIMRGQMWLKTREPEVATTEEDGAVWANNKGDRGAVNAGDGARQQHNEGDRGRPRTRGTSPRPANTRGTECGHERGDSSRQATTRGT